VPAGDQSRPLFWIASSKKDLMALSLSVRRFFGHALDFAQRGGRHDSAKPLKGFGGATVVEIIEDDAGGTCRAVYTVRFLEAVFVLHCFHKKSSERNSHAESGSERHSSSADDRREAGRGVAT